VPNRKMRSEWMFSCSWGSGSVRSWVIHPEPSQWNYQSDARSWRGNQYESWYRPGAGVGP
jgi:hypothetical protein